MSITPEERIALLAKKYAPSGDITTVGLGMEIAQLCNQIIKLTYEDVLNVVRNEQFDDFKAALIKYLENCVTKERF